MSHVDVHYTSESRTENDAKAIRDIEEYLGRERFDILVDRATTIQRFESVGEQVRAIRSLDMAFGFVGVSGYPFHAFCRRYCFVAYRNWMHDGDDAVQTDDAGFPIPLENAQ